VTETGLRRDVGFHADEGFDADGFARLVEIHHPIHHAVIGDGQRVHTQPGSAFGQGLGAAQSVEQGVFCVCVQVYKLWHGLAPTLSGDALIIA